jgi:hypothetical protein
MNTSTILQSCKYVKQNGGGSLDIRAAQDIFGVAMVNLEMYAKFKMSDSMNWQQSSNMRTNWMHS